MNCYYFLIKGNHMLFLCKLSLAVVILSGLSLTAWREFAFIALLEVT